MREYIDLGHMTKVSQPEQEEEGYFLPHHAVIKESSATTKVRVVYDGSANSSTGVSLNHTLKVGPTIQQTLFEIVIRSRKHEVVLIADIEKMFRMIKMHEDDRKFKRILWRENPSHDLEVSELNTVTYGTASAPYLTVRTVNQLADDERERFPEAANVIKRDFYIDDLYTRAPTPAKAIILRDQLSQMLQRGGFNLRKWCSNKSEIIKSLPTDASSIQLFVDSNEPIKNFRYSMGPPK